MKHRKLIAFLAAIIATFAIWQILNTQNKNKEAQMDYREVIVAAGEIKKGEVIPRSKLTLKKIPRQYTPEDALRMVIVQLAKWLKVVFCQEKS